MDAFQRELVRRLPLAQATLALFEYAIDAAFLQRVFQDNRGKCYEGELPFSSASDAELIRKTLRAARMDRIFEPLLAAARNRPAARSERQARRAA